MNFTENSTKNSTENSTEIFLELNEKQIQRHREFKRFTGRKFIDRVIPNERTERIERIERIERTIKEVLFL